MTHAAPNQDGRPHGMNTVTAAAPRATPVPTILASVCQTLAHPGTDCSVWASLALAVSLLAEKLFERKPLRQRFRGLRPGFAKKTQPTIAQDSH